jgi:hypothetical protein
MSAFLVSERTIHKILTELKRSVSKSEFLTEACIKELRIDFADPHWQDALGQKMLELNRNPRAGHRLQTRLGSLEAPF